jgi:hypothetical protein
VNKKSSIAALLLLVAVDFRPVQAFAQVGANSGVGHGSSGVGSGSSGVGSGSSGVGSGGSGFGGYSGLGAGSPSFGSSSTGVGAGSLGFGSYRTGVGLGSNTGFSGYAVGVGQIRSGVGNAHSLLSDTFSSAAAAHASARGSLAYSSSASAQVSGGNSHSLLEKIELPQTSEPKAAPHPLAGRSSATSFGSVARHLGGYTFGGNSGISSSYSFDTE